MGLSTNVLLQYLSLICAILCEYSSAIPNSQQPYSTNHSLKYNNENCAIVERGKDLLTASRSNQTNTCLPECNIRYNARATLKHRMLDTDTFVNTTFCIRDGKQNKLSLIHLSEYIYIYRDMWKRIRDMWRRKRLLIGV